MKIAIGWAGLGDMATFEELDGLLAEALQCLNDAAGLVRELTQLETKPSLMHLGHAINEAWELREHVHRIRPDLKPPFVLEYEEDRVRYNKLSEISKEAHQLEESGRSSEARGKFLDLRTASVRGYFQMVAEAGLFRISESESSNS